MLEKSSCTVLETEFVHCFIYFLDNYILVYCYKSPNPRLPPRPPPTPNIYTHHDLRLNFLIRINKDYIKEKNKFEFFKTF